MVSFIMIVLYKIISDKSRITHMSKSILFYNIILLILSNIKKICFKFFSHFSIKVHISHWRFWYFMLAWRQFKISNDETGRDAECAPKGMKNSQAKGPVSDEPLESNNKVAPKKQPITKFRVIFQVKMTERRTSIYLFCAFLCIWF